MATNGYKQAFDILLKSYLSLADNAVAIVRELRKARNVDVRRKLLGELQGLGFKQAALLDQMDDLAKSIPPTRSSPNS